MVGVSKAKSQLRVEGRTDRRTKEGQLEGD